MKKKNQLIKIQVILEKFFKLKIYEYFYNYKYFFFFKNFCWKILYFKKLIFLQFKGYKLFKYLYKKFILKNNLIKFFFYLIIFINLKIQYYLIQQILYLSKFNN